jgi:uncharacterized phage protein (TIGR01671 family)
MDMKQVKYRLWCNNKKEWEKDEWHLTSDGIIIDTKRNIEMKKETHFLNQFTGLFDKQGKEIYEGDIFIFNDELWTNGYTSCGTEYDSCEADNYGVVGFDEGTLRFDFTRYKYNENQVEADLHENHEIEFADFIQEHEVIGNIYENPELLKGSKQE